MLALIYLAKMIDQQGWDLLDQQRRHILQQQHQQKAAIIEGNLPALSGAENQSSNHGNSFGSIGHCYQPYSGDSGTKGTTP